MFGMKGMLLTSVFAGVCAGVAGYAYNPPEKWQKKYPDLTLSETQEVSRGIAIESAITRIPAVFGILLGFRLGGAHKLGREP